MNHTMNNDPAAFTRIVLRNLLPRKTCHCAVHSEYDKLDRGRIEIEFLNYRQNRPVTKRAHQELSGSFSGTWFSIPLEGFIRLLRKFPHNIKPLQHIRLGNISIEKDFTPCTTSGRTSLQTGKSNRLSICPHLARSSDSLQQIPPIE